MTRAEDGSAGDADYGAIGSTYTDFRRADPRIASFVHAALGDARTVINVGAGAGSYEPADCAVTAVEPSATMRAKRSANLPPAMDACADDLPFADDSFDAAMTTFSIHQWPDLAAGLHELRRVASGPVVVLTGDPERLRCGWLPDYSPEVIAAEAGRYPRLADIAAGLGGRVDEFVVPIPIDCSDGFNEAYYGRPEALLDPAARLANSAWSFVEAVAVERFEQRLRADLADGSWDETYGDLRTQPTFAGSLVLVVARST